MNPNNCKNEYFPYTFIFPALDVSVPYFNGRSSLLTLPTLRHSYSMTYISMEIRPSSASGLILLNTQLNGPDFIAVAMREGRVELWYDLGQGPVTIVSNLVLSLHEWHAIQIMRNRTYGELHVHNDVPVTGNSPGYFNSLQVSSNLYLGNPVRPSNLPTPLKVLGGYSGCLRRLHTSRTQGEVDLLGEAIDGRGIIQCPINCSAPFTGLECTESKKQYFMNELHKHFNM